MVWLDDVFDRINMQLLRPFILFVRFQFQLDNRLIVAFRDRNHIIRFQIKNLKAASIELARHFDLVLLLSLILQQVQTTDCQHSFQFFKSDRVKDGLFVLVTAEVVLDGKGKFVKVDACYWRL
jgi:hypothetical protein